ncbi:membrane protein [Arthrobacter phage Atuin]|nr:membrane protein [Arthrobacter phage Atuin]
MWKGTFVKRKIEKLALSWRFQWLWTGVMFLVLIWNLFTGATIGILISLAGLGCMAYTIHTHWAMEQREKIRQQRIRQWTEDDL